MSLFVTFSDFLGWDLTKIASSVKLTIGTFVDNLWQFGNIKS